VLNAIERATQWAWSRGLRSRELLARPFVRHVGALTAANGVSAVLSFVQGILVARWLGPELYGVAALVMSYPALVYTFFDARSSDASVKYLSEFHMRGERDRALVMCKVSYLVDFVIASLAFLVILVTAGWASYHVTHHPEAVGLILVYAAASLPRALGGTSRAVLTTLGRFPLIAWLDTATTFLRVALVLGLLLSGWQVAGVVWGNAITLLFMGVLYGAVAYHFVKNAWGASWLQGNWHALKGKRREIFGFLAYNDLNALLGMIPKQLDVVLLGYFRNPAEVGYYKLARSFSGAIAYLVNPLQSVTYPKLAQLWGVIGQEEFRRTVRRLALGVGAPLGLAVLLGLPFVPLVLPLLVGETYRSAIVAMQLLMVGSAVWLAFFWLRPMYLTAGEIRLWAELWACLAVLSVVGFFLIIPQFGFVGLAIWHAILSCIQHLVGTLLIRKRHIPSVTCEFR
jgi:O-antigen/teichoic acid export membrane protein